MQLDGFCYGYVQSRSGTVDIRRLGGDNEDTFGDDVTVIWTATSPEGERVIVGWYHAARIFRNQQVGNFKSREVRGSKIGFHIQARAENAVLIPAGQRDFRVPHHGGGLPGQASVFYPEDSETLEMGVWLGRAMDYMSTWAGNSVADHRRATGSGWPSPPDAAHNAAVEAAAIAFVRRCLGIEKKDRQKDNGGWDLEPAERSDLVCGGEGAVR
jgi:hypothetical protein